MLGRLILLFLLTPVIELGLLIQVDKLIGFGPTLALIVGTGLAGSYLARREGVSTWRRLNDRLRAGDLPGTELVDGVIILLAGTLLITPGVLTDVLGLVGLLPFTRVFVRRPLIRWLQNKIDQGAMQVQFGMFGGGDSSPNGTRWPPSSPENADSDGDARWQGQSRRVPRHTDDPNEDPSSANDDASSS